VVQTIFVRHRVSWAGGLVKGIDTLWLREYDQRPSEMRALFQRLSSIADLGRGADVDMLQKRDERTETHPYLQTKYRKAQAQFTQLHNHYHLEVREKFMQLRKRYYLIECAWCKRGASAGSTRRAKFLVRRAMGSALHVVRTCSGRFTP
jgi:hypothetical protein